MHILHPRYSKASVVQHQVMQVSNFGLRGVGSTGKGAVFDFFSNFLVTLPTLGTGKYFKFDQIFTAGDNKTV